MCPNFRSAWGRHSLFPELGTKENNIAAECSLLNDTRILAVDTPREVIVVTM